MTDPAHIRSLRIHRECVSSPPRGSPSRFEFPSSPTRSPSCRTASSSTRGRPERRGGQHVTRTSTGILALDTKTGIAAVSVDEQTMMKNREKALAKLQWLVAINAKERMKANEAPYQ